MTFHQGVYAFILMIILPGCAVAAYSIPGGSNGIELESTRVIYPEKAKNGVAFTVTNNTSTVYLLQSRILPRMLPALGSPASEQQKAGAIVVDTTSSDTRHANHSVSLAPFIVLPPLESLTPGAGITLRIRLTKNALPADRESVFILALKAIPQQSSVEMSINQASGQMVLALQNNLKLFYRPEGLPLISSDERAKQLKFSRQGKTLTINNPTPYYLTLSNVYADTQLLSLGNRQMIAPFSSESYEIAESHFKTVRWQLIDDNGIKGAIQTQNQG